MLTFSALRFVRSHAPQRGEGVAADQREDEKCSEIHRPSVWRSRKLGCRESAALFDLLWSVGRISRKRRRAISDKALGSTDVVPLEFT